MQHPTAVNRRELIRRAGMGVGSYLSHAGTIAREYQVPCLVDVNGATELIQDGARLHLDASAGTASVLGADR